MRDKDFKNKPYNMRGDNSRDRAYHVKGEVARFPDRTHTKGISVGVDNHKGPHIPSYT